MLPVYTIWVRRSPWVSVYVTLLHSNAIHCSTTNTTIIFADNRCWLPQYRKGQALQFNWLFENGAFVLHSDETFFVDFTKVPFLLPFYLTFSSIERNQVLKLSSFYRSKELLKAWAGRYWPYRQKVTRLPQSCFFKSTGKWQAPCVLQWKN